MVTNLVDYTVLVDVDVQVVEIDVQVVEIEASRQAEAAAPARQADSSMQAEE
jgi:hypothetical protein